MALGPAGLDPEDLRARCRGATPLERVDRVLWPVFEALGWAREQAGARYRMPVGHVHPTMVLSEGGTPRIAVWLRDRLDLQEAAVLVSVVRRSGGERGQGPEWLVVTDAITWWVLSTAVRRNSPRIVCELEDLYPLQPLSRDPDRWVQRSPSRLSGFPAERLQRTAWTPLEGQRHPIIPLPAKDVFARKQEASFREVETSDLAYTAPVLLTVGEHAFQVDDWCNVVVQAARVCLSARGEVPWRLTDGQTTKYASQDRAEVYRPISVGRGWWVNTCFEANRACSYALMLLKRAGYAPDEVEILCRFREPAAG